MPEIWQEADQYPFPPRLATTLRLLIHEGLNARIVCRLAHVCLFALIDEASEIHKTIDEDEVIPVVRKLLADSNPQTRASAQDAISDFSIFLGWNKRKIKKLLAA